MDSFFHFAISIISWEERPLVLAQEVHAPRVEWARGSEVSTPACFISSTNDPAIVNGANGALYSLALTDAYWSQQTDP